MLPTSLLARQMALALDALEPGDALALLRSAGPGAALRLSTARALHAVGLALGSGEPVCCLLGMASMASGATWEALNTAALTLSLIHISEPTRPY